MSFPAKKTPNYMTIYQELYAAIKSEQYGTGAMLPTECDLCSRYDVSRTTVRRALSMLVDSGMVERVAGRGTFVRTNVASKVAPRALLGVIMCDISVSYGLGLIRSIEHFAGELGYSVVYKDSCFDMAKETQAIKDLIRLGVDAIILQPLHAEVFNEAVMKLSLQDYPIVLVDRELTGLNLSFVGSDNTEIVRRVVKYLLARGHENICFVSSDARGTSTILDRLTAFNNTFIEENRQNYATNLYTKIRSTRAPRADNSLIEEDIRSLCAYLTANPQITCLFAAEYSICILIKAALKRLGKRIPDDISLVTFDNVRDDFFITSTSFIRQNEYEIGRAAVETAQHVIETGERTARIVPAEFVVNDSVKDLSNCHKKPTGSQNL